MKEDDPILFVDKPAGISSFDVIRILRRNLGKKKKLGHAGTLDPAASGLLIIGVGREGTKKLNEYSGLDKTYEVTIKFGERTDTGDTEGEVVERKNVDHIKQSDLEEICQSLVGAPELPVPAYSAVKVDGVPLYKRVRRGEKVVPPTRTMEIYDLVLKNLYQEDGSWYADLEMRVASGVYVRAVVEEIGRRMGYPAMTVSLRRTKVGEYDVKDAESVAGS